MKSKNAETNERLIRVCALRRGAAIELRVHYEIARVDGCDTYRLFTIEELE